MRHWIIGLGIIFAGCKPEPVVTAAPVQTVPVPPLLQHTTRAIEISNPKLSPTRRATLANMLTGIAEQVFDDRRHQEFWISLIGIESGYNGAAKSHKGATGLGQLMPQYRADFGKGCGMTEVDVSDLQDDFTNAYLSACFFRDLIGRLGTVPLALTAYNSGPHSPGMRSALNGGAPSEETSKYVTRIWTKNQKVKTEITKETK